MLIRQILLIAIIWLPGFLGAQEPPETSQPLVVGIREAPPFAIQGDDGTWSGVSIDLWRDVASDLGMDYEFRELSLAKLLQQTDAGEIDMAVAALTMTPEREARFDFSHPFLSRAKALRFPRSSGEDSVGC